MPDEVNVVVDAIFKLGSATIVVNHSHGDIQNLLHTELNSRVEYIQSNIKSLGMVQGLDEIFDGVTFLGYHAMAGAENVFLVYTGLGMTVRGLGINGTEVGEAGLNIFFAGAISVPVILAIGDKSFSEQSKAEACICRHTKIKGSVTISYLDREKQKLKKVIQNINSDNCIMGIQTEYSNTRNLPEL